MFTSRYFKEYNMLMCTWMFNQFTTLISISCIVKDTVQFVMHNDIVKYYKEYRATEEYTGQIQPEDQTAE